MSLIDDAIAAAKKYGIDPHVFLAQINQESGFNPDARSPAGAEGIAQFEPGTAAGLGINPWDPVQALDAAAKYMANSLRQYGGDYAKALAAYNAGGGTVNAAIARGGKNWIAYLPAETQNYIRIILGARGKPPPTLPTQAPPPTGKPQPVSPTVVPGGHPAGILEPHTTHHVDLFGQPYALSVPRQITKPVIHAPLANPKQHAPAANPKPSAKKQSLLKTITAKVRGLR